jgi:hypothetical protein
MQLSVMGIGLFKSLLVFVHTPFTTPTRKQPGFSPPQSCYISPEHKSTYTTTPEGPWGAVGGRSVVAVVQQEECFGGEL